MSVMLPFLTSGLLLGLSAGFAPGPLLTLVISETLRHNRAAGIKVALAPLITDLPIIGLTLYALSFLSDNGLILALLSLGGGCFVMWMGIENIRFRGGAEEDIQGEEKSLQKGILVNMLSPHPYLFWLSVGGPILNRAWQKDGLAAVLFVGSFYLLLVGAKIGLAYTVAHSRHFLSGTLYRNTIRTLGLLLCLFALSLLYEGVKLF